MWQLLIQTLDKSTQINVAFSINNCSHSCPSFSTWNSNSIHNNIAQTKYLAHCCLHFSSGHIFTSPAERVSNAIIEVHIAILIFNEQIATKKIGVSLLENVMANLFGCFLLVNISMKGENYWESNWENAKSVSGDMLRRHHVTPFSSPNKLLALIMAAWENSRHFTPLVSLWNDVWGTSSETPYWWRVTSQIWMVLLIGWYLLHPIKST